MQRKDKEKHKIPREIRKERCVAKTNMGVANTPRLNQVILWALP